MSTAHDRRAPGMARIPFDAMVEVGGALGPSFEARAVNLSEDGMSLRTAYLPEVGQSVMCRFDAGDGMTVLAQGEVQWNEDLGEGGEFGIRFTNLDPASTVALQRILGFAEEQAAREAAGGPPLEHGRKVRLHIEGLASPMRARIKGQLPEGVMAYTELGFAQMGRALDLEDAQSGERRPAVIDRVEVAVDDASRIPQLVFSLRYEGGEAPAPIDDSNESDVVPGPEPMLAMDAMAESPSAVTEPDPESKGGLEAKVEGDDKDDDEPNKLKAALQRGAAKVTPALSSWAKRAKIAAALLAARARKGSAPTGGSDVEIPLRRTTAPAPGGGLHTAGRKVVRGTLEDHFEEEAAEKPGLKLTNKKKLAIAGSIGIAGVLVAIALHKPAAAPPLAAAPAEVAQTDPGASAPPSTPIPLPSAKPVPPPEDPLAAAAAAIAANPAKPGKATPFTNGPVGAHPTTIKVKMDGHIDSIQGAAQPSGFTVVIPNRKTVNPSATLADKDGRLAAVNISNEASGAELNVSFKDGVPNYVVRAHGDTLELVLARPASHGAKAPEAHAKKKHGKKH